MAVEVSDTKALGQFGKALWLFRRATSATAPSQVVQAFIAVAEEEGKTLSDYATALGTNMSTASRHFLELSGRNIGKVVGHGLIVARENPADLRQKEMWLTERGKALKADMLAILND